MSGDRRPDEVAIVVRRPAADGPSTSSLLRSPEKLGYWHLVAGGVEWGEEPAAAAARELREETGLVATPVALGEPLGYDLAGDPEPVRARFPAGTERIVVWPFVADAPRAGSRRSTTSTSTRAGSTPTAAIALLHYPEPREIVRRAAA